MAKPTRTFSGVEGQKSTGNAGPEAIKRDLDSALKMFDPGSFLPSGDPGGIDDENMRAKYLKTINGVPVDGSHEIKIVAGPNTVVEPEPETNSIRVGTTGEIFPTPHASTHHTGGTDPIDPASIGALRLVASGQIALLDDTEVDIHHNSGNQFPLVQYIEQAGSSGSWRPPGTVLIEFPNANTIRFYNPPTGFSVTIRYWIVS